MNPSIATRPPELEYPESDGQPMADNTLQFLWITTIKDNLDALFREQADVFVAGDLLWYPEEGNPRVRSAPDVMVAFGRPKGNRGSYQQWREGGIPPQVVFEVPSPGNRSGELLDKALFYSRYGVEEYYLLDPETGSVAGQRRGPSGLQPIAEMSGWISPRLGIRFEPGSRGFPLFHPTGGPS